jgi:hypothetical protein
MSITRATATLACLGMALISADARACSDNRYAFTCQGMSGPAAEPEPARSLLDLFNFTPPDNRPVLPFMPTARPSPVAPPHDAVAVVERVPLPPRRPVAAAEPRPVPQRAAALPVRSAASAANEQLASAAQPDSLAATSLPVPVPPARSRGGQTATSEPMPVIEWATSASIEQEETRMRSAIGMGATAADEDAAGAAPASALAAVASDGMAPAATSWWKGFLLAWGGVFTLGSALRFIIG